MSFILQWLDGSKVALQKVAGSELRIGRGTDVQIRSDNVAVALTHALIETAGDEYVVVDQGSITGTYVNEDPIDRRALRKGDRIEVGDLRITVQDASPDRPLFLRIERTLRGRSRVLEGEAADDAGQTVSGGEVLASRPLDYDSRYSIRRRFLSRRTLGWLAFVVTAIVIAGYLNGGREERFMPGSLSAAHARAMTLDGRRVIGANDCHACHVPFGGPSDELCQNCHREAFHQMGKAEAGSCSDCHAEHRSLESLTVVSDHFCVECHRDLSSHGSGFTVANSVTAFGTDHPDFTFLVDRRKPGARVPAGDPALDSADPNPLKFNHECHLSGDCRMRPPNPASPGKAMENLDCASCHALSRDSGGFEPVAFEPHCGRCHVLTFDNRFDPLPHGLPLEAVAGVVANAYSGATPLFRKPGEDVGRIVSRSTGESPVGMSRTILTAQRAVRSRCEKCHEIRDGEVVPPVPVDSALPEMRRFDHSVHLSGAMDLTCGSCHQGIERSTSSRTLSLPSAASCTGCHEGEAGARPAGLAACSTCHYYHDLTRQHGEGWTVKAAAFGLPSPAVPVAQSPVAGSSSSERGGMSLNFGMVEIIILIIVIILAFLGGTMLVAWLSLRRERKQLDGQSRSGSRRQSVAPQPAPAPPPAEPAAAAEPSSAPMAGSPKTMMTTRRPNTIPDAPEGSTVMVTWMGSIMFTAGPNEGMRVPIDQSGMYIGRDAEMAQLVIDDARISRRHVWIGVRDGKPMVVDQGSTNGTFLNTRNNRISETVLSSGDEIILSEDVARFRFDA